MTSPSPVRPTATAPHCLAVADQWIADRIAADRVPDPHRLILGARDDDVAVPGPADRHGVYLPEAGQALVSSAGPVLRFATPAAAQPGSPAAAGLVPGHPGQFEPSRPAATCRLTNRTEIPDCAECAPKSATRTTPPQVRRTTGGPMVRRSARLRNSWSKAATAPTTCRSPNRC